ncbi:O-succinylhomoserine sulfhydrylase [Marinospirillum alkaliphilum]|uniref:O-succinylhomoserine sulfhydrylase n=1 Tax=Marinospirillum alkaliphilum DSM 21637 TaxID=1122209 RepID=A0A1K1X3D9_9GAMM|nr:O-succinylhomoserine sulfhydrylase [Marinospirillum alkaliphilum]SFX44160.1 O-succinylhomoserine sulfhydrylase [Marinospirillum alkaliphilum DSM 21637]
MTDASWGLDTLALRTGQRRTAEREHAEPIFTTSSYVFESAAHAAECFANETGEHNIYSRFTNPTVRCFEERLAALEGGDRAVATSSGMAAILSVCLAFLQQGDEVVCSRSVFGSTVGLFNRLIGKFGITTRFVELADLNAWEAACNERTRLFFVETPSNPLCELADLAALSTLARSKGVRLVVDNCFCTPALQKPLALGADIVVHSATKYLDGQGRMVGGAVVGNHKDMAEVFGVVRTAGPCMSPFNAWVFLKGLETLRLRMDAHSANALQLATWLQQQPGVARVHYAGLPDHPQYELAKRQMRAFGGVLSFEMAGGRDAAWKVIDATRMLSITANLGDAKTTITHPATTTHARVAPEARLAAGITDGLVRVAVGLEDIQDIQADLARGLAL